MRLITAKKLMTLKFISLSDKNLKQVSIAAFVLLLSFLLSSCGREIRRERSHPLFITAQRLVKQKHPAEAAKMFDKYLKVNPESSKTHRELAILYHETLDQPFLAIYHYGRLLELDANSTERANIEKCMVSVEKKCQDMLNAKYTDRISEFTDSKRQSELEFQNQKIRKYIVQLHKQNKKLSRELKTLYASAVISQEPIDIPKKENDSNSPKTKLEPVEKKLVGKSKKSSFHTVKKGDTLMRIAKKYYGDGRLYKLIYNANREILTSMSKLSTGQRLLIPPVPEENIEREKND